MVFENGFSVLRGKNRIFPELALVIVIEMAKITPTELLNLMGLIGNSGMQTGSLVPRANTPGAQQELYRDFMEAGRLADPDIWTKYYQATQRPVTYDAMLQLWSEMADWDLMHAALVEIVDETIQVDQNSPAVLWYECNDQKIEDELNSMVVNLDVETIIPSQVWYLASLGNSFEKIEYAPHDGVIGLSFVHPFDIRRYWLERNRKCIGFRWQGHKPSKESVFVHPDNKTPVQRMGITDGRSTEDLWYPWDFLHFRRMFRLRETEHGEPLFDEAQGIYKKLRLAIDQMVVHRAQVQPDRYAVNVDVKDQVPAEQIKTMQRFKQAMRSKLAFNDSRTGVFGDNPNSLSTPTGFESFYNAWALDTILWVARPNGFQHAIEKLPGTQNIPDVYDIELLTDLFFSIIGMPRTWFSSKSDAAGGDQAASGKALLAQDIRFLRKIKSLRRPIINCYTWLAYFHCVLRGHAVDRLNIRTQMPPIGGLEEQMKLEMLQKQAEILDVLADVMDKYNLPKEAWIEVIFKRYMHLPDDIVNIFITALPAQQELSGGEQEESLRGHRQPAPASHRLIREIDEVLMARGGRKLILSLQHQAKFVPFMNEKAQRIEKLRLTDGILKVPEMKDFDFIVSSYGRNPLKMQIRPEANGEKSTTTMMADTSKASSNGNSLLMENEALRNPQPVVEVVATPESQPKANQAYRRWMPMRR